MDVSNHIEQSTMNSSFYNDEFGHINLTLNINKDLLIEFDENKATMQIFSK